MQANLIMKVMNPDLPFRAALGYGSPFPSYLSKTAVVRAPRLGAASIFTAQQITAVRQLPLGKFLKQCYPVMLGGACCDRQVW